MKAAYKELYKAIHEGCWLKVEYRNLNEETTRYWIAVKDLDPKKRQLTVDGLHLGTRETKELKLNLSGILSAHMIEGTYCEINQDLVEDIYRNPEKYKRFFDDGVNLRILNYYAACWRLDNTPYKSNFTLVEGLDDEVLKSGVIELSDVQFARLISGLDRRTGKEKQRGASVTIHELGMNLLSVQKRNMRGIYVLAYQPVKLDVINRRLRADGTPVISTEFTIEGEKISARQFLSEDEMVLLEDFNHNAELVRDLIMKNNPGVSVDDMPYLIEIGRDSMLNPESEYTGILKQFSQSDEKNIPVPLLAFFGRITEHSRRRKSWPFAILDTKVNLDQLLAIHHAMRYPVSYVQGPPGTGKTQMITHLIVSAFFNDRTVLFSSYNNHPIDEVVSRLKNLMYKDREIPLPVVRLGNNEEVAKTLSEIKKLYLLAAPVSVYGSSLNNSYRDRDNNAKQLTQLLEKHERRIELLDRKETIETMIQNADSAVLKIQLETGQLAGVNRELNAIGEISIEDALKLIKADSGDLDKYLYYSSIQHIKRLGDKKNADLQAILVMEDKEKQVREFNRWLKDSDHLKRFQRIFPIIATTCMSAYKLGEPEPNFDMVIIDEASQCNPAVSLVPILRGKNLLLVGDPQQLQPVIQLSENDNEVLKKRYRISDDYDYRNNSIYKVYVIADPNGDEILLSHHYRCDPKIIGFNNKKYYNNKLKMNGQAKDQNPLVLRDVKKDISTSKNTAPAEVAEVIDCAKENPSKSIGIITPFVKQRELIEEAVKEHHLSNVDCGTVHTFQGDEKDIILFSLAVTNATKPSTYNWLKNNKELINVAVSRAREKLVLVTSKENLRRLHTPGEPDDIYELARYIMYQGNCEVTDKHADSRALGIRPYSTEIETAFLTNLNQALSSAWTDTRPFVIHKEVAISQVFTDNPSYSDYFYRGRFDFVVYRRQGKQELPVLAIELDGKEHLDEDLVKERDRKKNQICKEHGFSLIRVENCYARRYHHMKEILLKYFTENR